VTPPEDLNSIAALCYRFIRRRIVSRVACGSNFIDPAKPNPANNWSLLPGELWTHDPTHPPYIAQQLAFNKNNAPECNMNYLSIPDTRWYIYTQRSFFSQFCYYRLMTQPSPPWSTKPTNNSVVSITVEIEKLRAMLSDVKKICECFNARLSENFFRLVL